MSMQLGVGGPRPSTPVRADAIDGRLWAGGAPLVVCFPAAGSSSLSFRPLANALTERVTVLAVEPARRRFARLAGALARMADELAAQLRPWLSGDVTLIGHSFGGYVAYEVARRLVDPLGRGDRMTLRLVLVGCAAPTHAGGSPPAGDDDTLIESLTSLGAIPEELRREPALLRRYLPAIRADLQTVDEYVRSFRTEGVLPVPALAVRGCFDPLVPTSALAGWQQLCRSAVVTCLPGDHYLPQRAAPALAVEILRWTGANRLSH